MNNVKKISISFIVGLIIGCAVVGFISQRRAIASYSELESRYSIIKESNIKLRKENSQLVANNIRYGELITEGRAIIEEFNGELERTNDTIGRIEKGIRTLEQIIELLFPEDED